MLLWAAQQAAVRQQSQLSLSGMDCELPSIDQQAEAKQTAMGHLRNYINRCGGSLPSDWSCGMRFRITTRRNGNVGRTTDNYYYSPCGKTFRTHKQVAEFLGLEPQPAHLPPAQPQEPQFDVVVLSVKTASAADKQMNTTEAPSSSASGHMSGQRAPLPAQPMASDAGCSAAALESLAVPAASSCASEVPSSRPDKQNMQQQQTAPPAVAKRTKHMLAAKYSCATNSGDSHLSLGNHSRSGISSSAGGSGAAAASHTAESALATSHCKQLSSILVPAVINQQRSEQPHKRQRNLAALSPTDSTSSQSAGTTSMAPPPPKRKKVSPQQPAWRANLRALATAQFAAMLAEKQQANNSSSSSNATT